MSSNPITAPCLDAQLDHVTIVTAELERLHSLLQDVIGFQEGPRPPFGVSGHWFYLDGRAVIHLIRATEPAYIGVLAQPRIDHVAFRLANGTELHALIERLDRKRVPYRVGRALLTNETQLFIAVAPGAQLEFTLAEAASNQAAPG